MKIFPTTTQKKIENYERQRPTFTNYNSYCLNSVVLFSINVNFSYILRIFHITLKTVIILKWIDGIQSHYMAHSLSVCVYKHRRARQSHHLNKCAKQQQKVYSRCEVKFLWQSTKKNDVLTKWWLSVCNLIVEGHEYGRGCDRAFKNVYIHIHEYEEKKGRMKTRNRRSYP